MKINKLTITNIGMIESEIIPITSPLILFYGQIKQGKTTILNAVRYVFGGAFPDDLLTHGKAEGAIRIDFEGGYLARTFYRTDTGTVRARPLDYVTGGKKVLKPVDTLKQFLNPFLLDQDHIVRMNPLERNKFFVDLFEAGSAGIDEKLNVLETEAREVRAKIAGYGDLDLVPQARVNIAELRAKLVNINTHNAKERAEAFVFDRAVEQNNILFANGRAEHTRLVNELDELKSQMQTVQDQIIGISNKLGGMKEKTERAVPELVDTAAVEEEISNAAAQNVRAEHFEKNVARECGRKGDCMELADIEQKERELREARIKRLTEINSAAKVPGLIFSCDGPESRVVFSYEGTSSGMLSTSQLMELSSKLSTLYPEGFGIELLDRGESLGRSIFEYVERATKENKTILATIVGERPTTTPEHVGVFVVADGKLSQP